MTVIIGAGLAGLATALHLAPHPCVLITAGTLRTETPWREPASGWAQGGVAAAIAPDDHPALHTADTLAAGAGLCDPSAVAAVTAAAPAAIEWLVSQGVPFDRTPTGELALGLEGAHGRRRIVHARGDSTGAEIMRTLTAVAARTPSITVLEHTRAARILTGDDGAVTGVEIERAGGRTVLPARNVVLATGGVGGLWSRTTNPLGSWGQGLVLAARAGALLRDLEMVQFHPTALDVGGLDPMPLVSEAVRGEGAILVTADGHPVLDNPLAARDVVARAVFAALQRGERVLLDARHLGAEFPELFPTVTAKCRAAGIDPVTQPLPVSPAAHYHMGGVVADVAGRTSVPGLWAVGEVASTGLHGANRLASNSLLEAVVMGTFAAQQLAGAPGARDTVARARTLAASGGGPLRDGDRPAPDLRRAMFDVVGVLRDGATLRALVARLQDEAVDWVRLAGAPRGERAVDAVPAATLAALAIAWSALRREESRGAHTRLDFPDPRPAGHQTLALGDLLLSGALA